jgi:hypothetical protein
MGRIDMAGLVFPSDTPSNEYQGIPSIFEFTNSDGECILTNCGQAAAATFLTFHGKLLPAKDEPSDIMESLERLDPPDNLGGAFGTSRRCVVRICRRHGIHLREIAGEAALREELGKGRPVIVMLGVCAGQLFHRINLPGGHWMVAYGFDSERVYLTNRGSMTWLEVRKGWAGIVPRLIGMRGKGLVAAPNV